MAETDDDAPSTGDDALLAVLGEALGPDPLPPGLTDRARALLTFADTDAELLVLLEERSPIDAGVRGGASDASDVPDAPLVYASDDGEVTIEIVVVDGSLSGLLVGLVASRAALELADGRSVDVPVGVLGRFRLAPAPQGSARLRVDADGGTFCTGWFVI